MKTLVSCYEINFDDFIMLLEKFVLNDENIHWKKIDCFFTKPAKKVP